MSMNLHLNASVEAASRVGTHKITERCILVQPPQK